MATCRDQRKRLIRRASGSNKTSFIAGRYTNSYDSLNVGITDNGIELQQDSRWEEISTSDAYGDSIIDGVYRGGSVFLQFECKAFKTGSVTPFWPWGALGVMQTVGGAGPAPVGRLASDVASDTVLTALAGTPAVTQSHPGAVIINTLTASLTILASNSSAKLLFTTRLRQVPIRLVCLPYETTLSGQITTQWFTTT